MRTCPCTCAKTYTMGLAKKAAVANSIVLVGYTLKDRMEILLTSFATSGLQ